MEQTEAQMQLDDMGTMGPGRYLKNARQNKKLRIEDVAFELRLTPGQVTALEEDDYSRMPEVTYVRGYLRNYARLLGLPVDDVLMAHARITRNDDVATVTVAPVSEREIHVAGAGIRFIPVLLVLAVIGVAAYWFMGREATAPVTVAGPEPEAPVIEQEVPTGVSRLTLDTPGPVTPAEPASAPAAAAPTARPEAQSGTAASADDPVAKAPDSPVAARARAGTSAATASAADTGSVSTPVKPADAGIGKLVIHYQKSCWTDIRDAKGRKLVYRTVPAGETIRVEGKTPISLFFGFAVGIDLSFNGRPVDLKQHTRGVFARLTLGN